MEVWVGAIGGIAGALQGQHVDDLTIFTWFGHDLTG